MTASATDLNEKRPAVFFDRDGVVNRSPGDAYYVTSWEQFEFSPGIFEALSIVKEKGYLAILVTSQKGVGKGLMTQATLDDIHERMQTTLLEKAGHAFDGVYAYTGPECQHQPKPDPEMVFSAVGDHGIDLSQSWMIGDADRDIEMGIAAGLKGTIRVVSEKALGVKADHTFESTSELPQALDALL